MPAIPVIKNIPSAKEKTTGSKWMIPFLLLALSGISFCFFAGFPFDNHNESYLWIVALNKISLRDALTHQVIGGIESFRPLGMANAWITYKLTGNIYLQEILNWICVLISFTLLYKACENKILFALLAFITGICFFSGYIYLFHLHGVFYGPFQVYTAALACVAYKRVSLNSRLLILTFVATLIVSLYHTFALLVYCGFLAGYAIPAIRVRKWAQVIRLLILIVFTLLFAKLILQAKTMKPLSDLIEGILTSFKMIELNKAFAGIAAVLAVVTILPMIKTKTVKLSVAVTILSLALLLIGINIPVLILWIFACLLKALLRNNWPMAGLLASTAILPVGSSSGSPTYVVFVIMLCVFVMADSDSFRMAEWPFLKRATLSAIALLFASLLFLKMGFAVPVIASAVRPLLAEQEKTRQLEKILSWKINTPSYEHANLTLYDKGGLPVQSGNSVNRVNRPVTDQYSIDTYLDFFGHGNQNAAGQPVLYITFGNKLLTGKEVIFSVKGKWNGDASVFR